MPVDKYIYEVHCADFVFGRYEVQKTLAGDVIETYDVLLGEGDPLQLPDSEDVYCSCPGFRAQKRLPKNMHKHVQLAVYMQKEIARERLDTADVFKARLGKDNEVIEIK